MLHPVSTEMDFKITLSAFKSLSRLCPQSIVSLENIDSRTACTSLIVVVTFFKSASVTPLNLKNSKVEKTLK